MGGVGAQQGRLAALVEVGAVHQQLDAVAGTSSPSGSSRRRSRRPVAEGVEHPGSARSSGSQDTKPRPRKYCDGGRSSPGACSGMRAQCSSRRSSQKGSQPAPASRNATRSSGKRAITPPTVKLVRASMAPTGWVMACLARRVENRSIATGTCPGACPPPWTQTGTPRRSATDHTTSKARVVQVPVEHVLGGDHPHEAVLGDAALQLLGGRAGVEHRELRHQLEPLGSERGVLGPGVVQGAARARLRTSGRRAPTPHPNRAGT